MLFDARFWLPLLSMAVLLASCDGEGPNKSPQPSTDAALPEDVEEDAEPEPEVQPPAPGSRVEIDLAPWLANATPDPGDPVEVFEAESADDLVPGDMGMGRPGDWVLQNRAARFVVERDVSAIGPCPYGGNIIDAALRNADGSSAPDDHGEVCMFLNAGRTLKPELFEVLQTGDAGVLAATGRLELLDFVHFQGMASELLAGIELDIPISPDAEIPVTATVYHVLQPGQRRVSVITALRNDSDAPVHILFSHVVHAGGVVEYFNPLNGLGGFGFEGIDTGNIRATRLPFLAFRGHHSSSAYVPAPNARLSEGALLPVGGGALTVAGATIVMLGQRDILSALLTTAENLPTLPGALHIEPGGVATVEHTTIVGDNSLASVLTPAYEVLDVDTIEIAGTVRDARSEPVSGARVSAVRDERAFSQAVSGDEGRWSMRVPAGDYAVRGHLEGRLGLAEVENGLADVVLSDAGVLSVRIQGPDGAPSPGRVMVMCDGPCPEGLSSLDTDVTHDPPGGGAVRLEFVGVDGRLDLSLAPGAYKVNVSRGMTHSVWPPDAPETGGRSVEIVAGQREEVVAEIARVVETPGVLSVDMHVHASRSLDSAVANKDRVLGFLAAGVDVLVSTDHDVVTDFGPAVASLGASDKIVTVVGQEITTANYGHYNTFPVVYDDAAPGGGAMDWAGGPGFGLTPAQIFAAAREHPGEQVVQVNHPEASGLIASLRSDPLRGITLADPENFRLPPTEPDPLTGDTGLWSDDFTAIEIMNGTRMSRFWERFRWWLQMIGRGFSPAGTAVTDTHKLRKVESGVPRTFAFVGEGRDSPETFDPDALVGAINGGQIIGTNGPFFRVTATNADGAQAGPGETLAAVDGAVTLTVSVTVPEWIEVDTIDVYQNITEGIFADPGQSSSDPVPATFTTSIDMTGDAVQTVAEGDVAHRRRTREVTFERPVTVDSYLLVVVRGQDVPSMFPGTTNAGARPFAYAHPIFVDADGGGYDNPPLRDAARTDLPRSPKPALRRPLRARDLPGLGGALDGHH